MRSGGSLIRRYYLFKLRIVIKGRVAPNARGIVSVMAIFRQQPVQDQAKSHDLVDFPVFATQDSLPVIGQTISHYALWF
jgi:hypothetical protein